MFHVSNFLLQIANDQPIEGFEEKLIFGGRMLLIGMGIVFGALILLWGTLVLFRAICTALMPKANTPIPVAAPQQQAPLAPAPQAASETACPEEIVAVIAAAFAMANEEAPNTKFRVVSFKRI